MFEKKKKKQTLLDSIPSSYEEISNEAKRWHYANIIYIVDADHLYNINSIGVVSDIVNKELITVFTKEQIKQSVFMNKIKLFIDHDAKKENSEGTGI